MRYWWGSGRDWLAGPPPNRDAHLLERRCRVCNGLGVGLVKLGQLGRNLQKVSPPHPLFQRADFPSAGRVNRYTPPRSATVWGSAPVSPSIVTASSPTGPRRLCGRSADGHLD